MDQMAQLKQGSETIPSISKFLRLRVHHLSAFLINLWVMGGEPYMIEIKFNMENYVDTPSSKNTPRAVIYDDITLYKLYNFNTNPPTPEIITYKKNEFIFKRNQSVAKSTSSNDINTNQFDWSFKTLETNINTILDINKVIKKTKQLKKKQQNMMTKQHYRALLRGYEKEKSEAKKNIRDVIIKLYS